MADEISFRHLGPVDLALLCAVEPGLFDADIRPDQARAFLNDPHHEMVLAFDGAQAVGMVSGTVLRHPDKPPAMFINEVGTRESHQRRGIATALTERMIEIARARGCEGVWLGTETDNLPARGLYRKLGGDEVIGCLLRLGRGTGGRGLRVCQPRQRLRDGRSALPRMQSDKLHQAIPARLAAPRRVRPQRAPCGEHQPQARARRSPHRRSASRMHQHRHRATEPAFARSLGNGLAGSAELRWEVLHLGQAVLHGKHGFCIVDMDPRLELDARDDRGVDVNQIQTRVSRHDVTTAERAPLAIAVLGLVVLSEMLFALHDLDLVWVPTM